MRDIVCIEESLKKKLCAYRERSEEIYNQSERLDNLTTKMMYAGALNITDMPTQREPSVDRMADYVARKEELEASIKADIEQQKKERQEIEVVLRHISSAKERAVIRMRYFDGEGWSSVTNMMFGGYEDYLDKEDSYVRRVHKLHKKAISNMAKYIAKTDQQGCI